MPNNSTKPVAVAEFDGAAVHAAVHSFMDAICKGEALEYRWPTLRASSFPYCPIIMALTEPVKGSTYRMDYFFKTGTAIHELIQNWASRVDYKPKLWGMWKCTGCGEHWSDQPGFKPREGCDVCAANGAWSEWLYDEVTLTWRGLSGHVDTILKIGPGAYVVVDYKTTEFKFNGALNDRKRFPYGANVVQISIYCSLLRELYNLPIVGWCLVYAHRGRPIKGPKDYHLSVGSWTIAAHERMMRRLGWANRTHVLAAALIEGRFNGEVPDRQDVEDLVADRPCKTIEHYKSWMQSKFKYEEYEFMGKGACPHVEKCTGCADAELVDYFTPLLSPNPD